jgi:flagellar motor switch protein FliN/FliY
MAEEEQTTPEQPEDSAADTSQPSPPDPAPADDPKARAAAEALAAAQAAINQLNDDTGSADEPPAPSADAAPAQAAPQPATPSPSPSDGTAGLNLPSFSLNGSTELPDGLALLKDVNLDVKIELGRTRMVVDDVLRLSEGAVVELDKLAGDPVDIYVNGRHIARGEVLVLNENFCVRISEILAGAEAAAKQIASAAADAMSA